MSANHRSGALAAALIAKTAARERIERELAEAVAQEARSTAALNRAIESEAAARVEAEDVWCAGSTPARLLASRRGAAAQIEGAASLAREAQETLDAARAAVCRVRVAWSAASAQEEAVTRVTEARRAGEASLRRSRAEEDGE
jgi:hypothetical protein